MGNFVIPNGPNGEVWWDGLPSTKQMWGEVLNMIAEPAIEFAESFGFNTVGEINAMTHTYVAAQLAYNIPGCDT